MAEPVTAADDGEVNRDHEQHRHQDHLHRNRQATTSFPMTRDTASSTRTTSSMRHQSKWPASPASIRFRLCTGAASVWLVRSSIRKTDLGVDHKNHEKKRLFSPHAAGPPTRERAPLQPQPKATAHSGGPWKRRARVGHGPTPPQRHERRAQNGRKWRFG